MDLNDVTQSPPPPVGTPNSEERMWAMFAHLSILVGGIITAGWAGSLGSIVGPLIIWQIKKDQMPFVVDQAKEALNFSIMIAAIMVALTILGVVTLFIGFIIIAPIMGLIGLAALVLIIIASIKAHEGTAYRYPFTIRFIK